MSEKGITDTGMRAEPTGADQWLTEGFGRGNGALLGRISPAGERSFYYRYTGSNGVQVREPIGPYNGKGNGNATFTVAQARARALQWAALRREQGIVDLREHLAQVNADRAQSEALERQRLADLQREREEAAQALQRRATVRQLFDMWRAADLQPRTRADGRRTGRKDGGQYVLEQFTRHVFPAIGARPVEEVRKAELLALLDAQKAAGKMRTANVLLADMKQMLDFAQERDLIVVNPLATVKKRKVGGPSTKRDRALSDDEIAMLASRIAGANMHPRSVSAIWLTLATGVRIGELMGAVWATSLPEAGLAYQARVDELQTIAEGEGAKLGIVDLEACSWYLPDTKNQRDHTIHLSPFALAQFRALAQHRERLRGADGEVLSPWVFPATDSRKPVCIKSFGKQLADRQRQPEQRLRNRAKTTTALMLPGGRWTAHDLRRTASTVMARCEVNESTIHECLNHVQANPMSLVYIQDRRVADQIRAFDVLGAKLAELTCGTQEPSNVVALLPRAA